MTVALSIGGIASTTATINVANRPADGTIEWKLSPREDFQFCVVQRFTTASAATTTHFGLNQQARYYIQARAIRADGTREKWSDTLGFFTAAGLARDLTPPQILVRPAMIVVPEPICSVIGQATVAGYPPENMLVDNPVAWVAGTAAAGQYYFDVILSGAPVDTVALLQTNIPEDATVTIDQMNDAGGLTAHLVTAVAFRASPRLPGRLGYHGLFSIPQGNYRRLRIYVLTANVTGGRVQIGHVVVGLNRATKNQSDDKAETGAQLGTVDRRRSGSVDRVLGLPTRKIEMDLSLVREVDYENTYADLMDQQGRAVLLVPNSRPGAYLHDRIAFGTLTGTKAINPKTPYFTVSVSVESII